MLLSISLIMIVGMSMGWICQKIKLPSLIGMLAIVLTAPLGAFAIDFSYKKLLKGINQ